MSAITNIAALKVELHAEFDGTWPQLFLLSVAEKWKLNMLRSSTVYRSSLRHMCSRSKTNCLVGTLGTSSDLTGDNTGDGNLDVTGDKATAPPKPFKKAERNHVARGPFEATFVRGSEDFL